MKVSSQYGSDSFLSVWYRHGTDSGNFHKTFNAYISSDQLLKPVIFPRTKLFGTFMTVKSLTPLDTNAGKQLS